MSELFLSPTELKRMTGFTQPAAQARWLDENDIPNKMNSNGVVVLRAWAENAPLWSITKAAPQKENSNNLPKIHRLGGQ